MARNTSPKWKRYRRLGMPVPGGKSNRNYPPGQHGNKRRQRLTEYGLQLREKQKAKLIYGLLERQFRGYYEEAQRKTGNTGDILMILLESRLDNVVYRAGYAKTREQARQLVTHGHFQVNGKKCDIPSRMIKIGDEVAVTEKAAKNTFFTQLATEMKMHEAPAWVQVNRDTSSFKVVSTATKEDIEQIITVNLIVEFYSR